MLDVELRLSGRRLFEDERVCVTGTDSLLRESGVRGGVARGAFLKRSCYFIDALGATHPETRGLLRHLYDALYEKQDKAEK